MGKVTGKANHLPTPNGSHFAHSRRATRDTHDARRWEGERVRERERERERGRERDRGRDGRAYIRFRKDYGWRLLSPPHRRLPPVHSVQFALVALRPLPIAQCLRRGLLIHAFTSHRRRCRPPRHHRNSRFVIFLSCNSRAIVVPPSRRSIRVTCATLRILHVFYAGTNIVSSFPPVTSRIRVSPMISRGRSIRCKGWRGNEWEAIDRF